MPTSEDESIRRPSADRIAEIATALGYDLTETELARYPTLVGGILSQIDHVAEAPVPAVDPQPRYPERSPGYRPDTEEDPHNAWIVKCRVEGGPDGVLAGKTVGLKDTIALAGYEVTAGSTLLAEFTPEIDATVVTRLLDAGATIVGKQNMESLAHSGAGDFSDYGAVTNPHDDEYLAGGSSSGSAAALAAGDCDLSIGGDQIGSIRVPSAWCGVVGLKPTYSLVPYMGIVPSELSYDHVGPMARSVEDVATALDVIAGVDRRGGVVNDPRQSLSAQPSTYANALQEAAELDGVTLGVLEEGFSWDQSHDEVEAVVAGAIDALEQAGVTTTAVSVDLHRLTVPICLAVLTQGQSRLRQEGSVGTNRRGWFWADLGNAVDAAVSTRPDELPVTAKAASIAAAHLNTTYGIRFYAKAKNLVLQAARQYNHCLEACDAIVMPTTPMLPYERDDEPDPVKRRGGRPPNFVNTGLTGLTGHPSLSVPCGWVEGLPVGLMLVGDWFDEARLLAIGHAVELALA